MRPFFTIASMAMVIATTAFSLEIVKSNAESLDKPLIEPEEPTVIRPAVIPIVHPAPMAVIYPIGKRAPEQKHVTRKKEENLFLENAPSKANGANVPEIRLGGNVKFDRAEKRKGLDLENRR